MQERSASLWNFIEFSVVKIFRYFDVFFPKTQVLVLLFALLLLENKKYHFLMISLLVTVPLAWLPVSFDNHHYSAPLIAPFFLLFAGAVEVMWRKEFNPYKLVVLFVIILGLIWSACIRVPRFNNRPRTLPYQHHIVQERLSNLSGEHVVFVKYNHNKNIQEVVYNSANIDQQKIVWARDMGPEKNKELLAYYPKRKFWFMTMPCHVDCPDIGEYVTRPFSQ